MLEILDDVRYAIETHKLPSLAVALIIVALVSGVSVASFAVGPTYTTTKTVFATSTTTQAGQTFYTTTYVLTGTTITQNQTWTYTWTVTTTTQTQTQTQVLNPVTITVTRTNTTTYTVTNPTYVNVTITG